MRIFVVDPHRLLGEALANSLRQHGDMSVAGISECVSEALPILAAAKVDLVLVDASAGYASALAEMERLRRQVPGSRILPIGLRSELDVLAFLEAGAAGYVLRDVGIDDLVRTIRAVHQGEPPCSTRVVAAVCARILELDHARRQRRKLEKVRLTVRETEVLELIAGGLLNKEIAQQLSISLATVKNHVHNILEKLEARNRRDAIRRAYRGGLLLGPLPHGAATGLWQSVLASGPRTAVRNGIRPSLNPR